MKCHNAAGCISFCFSQLNLRLSVLALDYSMTFYRNTRFSLSFTSNWPHWSVRSHAFQFSFSRRRQYSRHALAKPDRHIYNDEVNIGILSSGYSRSTAVETYDEKYALFYSARVPSSRLRWPSVARTSFARRICQDIMRARLVSKPSKPVDVNTMVLSRVTIYYCSPAGHNIF